MRVRTESGKRHRRVGRVWSRRAREQAGMTLIELMVAISLIALIMSGLALSIGVDYKAVALARSRQVAENAANQRLEELRDVDYATMALSSRPVQNTTDPNDPDYYVSTISSVLNYDVTGLGRNEVLIVADGTPSGTPIGPVQHLETPVTIGTTVVDVYQYVTWVDDASIPGTQNLKRLSVVVKYHSVPTVGASRLLRESVVLTNGTVTLPDTATPTTTTTTTTTPASTTTTTAPATPPCGTFSIAGSSGATIGYTASTTVTITMALTGCPGTVLASFSNDGGTTWSPDVTYSSSSPNLAWTLTTGDGTKTIAGRVRNGSSGAYTALASKSIVLDTTLPTMPTTLNRTVSCSGTTRTVNLSWSAATDTYLVGYHVYTSSDGTVWVLDTSSAGLTATTTNFWNSTAYYRVKAYDAAGNESSATSTIALSKKQCS